MPLFSTLASSMMYLKNGTSYWQSRKHLQHSQNILYMCKQCQKKKSKQHSYSMAVDQMQELTENFAHMVNSNCKNKKNETIHYLIVHNEIAELKASSLHQQPTPKQPTQEHAPLVDHGSYCWSHGFCIAPKHNSRNSNPRNQVTKTNPPKQTPSMAQKSERHKRDNAGQSNDNNTNIVNSVATEIDQSPTIINHNAIFNTGTTGHYLLLDTACTELELTQHPICVTLPNGAIIARTHTAKLPFPCSLTQQNKHTFSQD
jgi:hypothetical protein